MCKTITEETSKTKTEEPTRINNFHNALQNIKWSDDEYIKNLETIYKALIEIASNDLTYYNDQRTKNKTKSYRARLLSLIFGVLGTLMMAIPGTAQGVDLLQDIPFITFSFISFALAGGMFTWNQWFFASDSHIRYVVAQFDLGEAIVKFTLNWQKWLKQNKHLPPDNIDTDSAFNLFKEFSEHIYKIIRNDTQVWGDSLINVIKAQEDFLKNHQPKS